MQEIKEKRKYERKPPTPWIRAELTKQGEQLWIHATEEQIAEAKKQGQPVHRCF